MTAAALDRLLRLHPKSIDLGLGRVERLLGRLGRPERALPPVVHVAGTNGKGSVIAFLRAFIEAAGFRAHVYTSPHLVRFNERIRLAGEVIADDALAALLEECEEANTGDDITFFEITTAAAFLAFSRSPADVLLLETGLGGRLDATTVADPVLTVITSIALDHQHYLGDSIEQIAGEKAGILKKDVPCLVARQERKAAAAIVSAAEKAGAPLIHEGRDWYIRKTGDAMVYESGGVRRALPLPGLAGGYQMRNAAIAIAAADQLSKLTGRITVDDAAIRLGLKTVSWPARLQRLNTGPLAGMLAEGWELWLDGGHNPAAAKALAAHARTWRDKPLYLIFAMMRSKDPEAFLKPFEAKLAGLRAVAIPGEGGAYTAERLVEAAMAWRMAAETAESVATAVDDIVGGAPGPARILICGSLYLAGSVLRENGQEKS
jgi:dihydrofolate synthase/folylpolyglutamate synthase